MNTKKPTSKKIDSNTQNKRNEDEDDNERVSSDIDITVSGDHVWFYGDVTQASSMKLNKILQDLSMRLAPTAFTSMHEISSPSPIWLHINSYGGEVFSSLAIGDTIERINAIVPVITIVEGCAASGATFISIAGSKRLMRKNAYMLVHELNDSTWGRFSALKDSFESNVTLMKTIKDMYAEKTKLPKKELDAILSHDIWWNAKTCLKYGLVDQII